MTQAIGQTRTESQGPGSSSFLVRMWREPHTKGDGPVRVYLRNLQTGEELYLGDPGRVGEVLSHEAETVGQVKRSEEQLSARAEAS